MFHRHPVTSSGTPSQQMNVSEVDRGTPLGGRRAPNFTLVNRLGQAVQLARLHGRVVMLAFVDPNDPLSSLTVQVVNDALKLLGPKGAKGIRVLAVSTDPAVTTSQAMASWGKRMGLSSSWELLTGSDAQLKSVWQSYFIQPAGEGANATAAIYVIDRRGHERNLFLTGQTPGGVAPEAVYVAKATDRWLAESVPLHDVNAIIRAGASPSAAAPGVFSIPRLSSSPGGSATVSTGDKKAHLVAFFATWCHSCKQDLTVLKAYQAQRQSHPAWPSLVAVDLRLAESSTEAVRRFVSAQGITFPVGLDTTGRITDEFQVTALPALALVSPQGTIVWRHFGVMSLSALTARIRASASGSD